VSIVWPESALDQALTELALAVGLAVRTGLTSSPPAKLAELDTWIPRRAERLGFQALATECSYAEVPRVLAQLGPALVRVTRGQERMYLAVVSSNARRVQLLTPALKRTGVPLSVVLQLLTAAIEDAPARSIDHWLSSVGIGSRQRRRAGTELLKLQLAERRLDGFWLLRPDSGSSFVRQLRHEGVLRRGLWALALSLGHVLVALYGWLLLGKSALGGAADPGWISAWVLTTSSALLFQIAALWLGGRVLNEAAVLLKQRLLCGALRLALDRIRECGSGRLLAMVSESEALENAGLAGSFAGALALLQLLGAAVALAFGTGGWLHVLLLFIWSGVVALLARRNFRARAIWTSERLGLAHGFVENVVGNRSRIAQQPRPRWHLLEDQQLRVHLDTSAALDASQVLLSVVPARGWLLIGFAGLIPVLLGEPTDPVELAIAVGGILQAYAAWSALAAGAITLGGVGVAWQQVAGLFRAAARLPLGAQPGLVLGSEDPNAAREAAASRGTAAALLDLRGVYFRHRAEGEPTLNGCNLSLRAGDRLLLEGPSGGGKSTLASLLVGLRSPGAGHILIDGLDRSTLGHAGWLKRIASAPQFHENHILSASLAFNLLMGRCWPPSARDRSDAEQVCRELGLEPLLGRMPSGLDQIVGETGWQLSHGERSRIFLARALLQQADLLVFDESFGALDPETLSQCMNTVLARAQTLIVIAHP